MSSVTGLEGVVVANTVLSDVDGERGRLVVRGAAIESLAGHVPFEEVAAKLWQDLAPDEHGASAAERIGAARLAAHDRLKPLVSLLASRPPLEALRVALASLPDEGASHLLVTGAVAVALAAALRGEAIEPDPTLGHAADFMRMAGLSTDPAMAAALDAYLVTVAEHGMNASTFTARVIASTRASVVGSTVGALCALAGPLHGGAPGPVLDMLDAIQAAGDAEAWLTEAVNGGDRLMGFGHRVYRVRDPRADVLKGVVARLRASGDERLAFAEHVERTALDVLAKHKPDRRLDTNVEFYTALLLEALRIPREAFTAVFAMGRVAGWTAHHYEQQREGRLMRPLSAYVGPAVNE